MNCRKKTGNVVGWKAGNGIHQRQALQRTHTIFQNRSGKSICCDDMQIVAVQYHDRLAGIFEQRQQNISVDNLLHCRYFRVLIGIYLHHTLTEHPL
jgi:hypothetical protein